ncbi:Two-component response regulator, YesN/AraC family, consists of REC and AraC-type DNA-binding domains [Paenibacillus sp. UNCCL117]|uniref:response regulator n=1 Tax=unclassified Paenibacillus TaxID=185978 RepID=UPI00088708AE|nr:MULTISPECIES: response regulator [unclassified Paenibacillus]SDD90386.1 Two-component response regulator, YesN/AraC family, consists of REC and AraC-type DNA-binding domains [Paenibacillus sp. cl123]SFW43928.1 Two-component response regulator, YesN/AraC family, consists of REC and AraC-type DNA-binding domains [Paenibacillus sp. UNCCL117]
MPYTILIVDDDKRIRDGLTRHIEWERIGFYEPLHASGGFEALELCQRTPVDVIITDIKMAGMSGLDFAERMMRFRKQTIMIILSGFGDFEYAKTAMKFGIRHYLTKPTDLTQLTSVLEETASELDSRLRQTESLKAMEERYREAIDLFAEQFLLRLAHGLADSPEAVHASVREYRLTLPYSSYALASLASADHAALAQQMRRIRRRCALWRETSDLSCYPFVHQEEERIYLLLNYDDRETALQALRQLRERSEQPQRERADLAISGPVAQLSDISLCFNQLRHWPGAAGPMQVGGFADYAEHENERPEPVYPAAEEKRLVLAMSSGDTERAALCLERIFAELHAQQAHPEKYREYFVKLFFAMERAVAELKSDIHRILGERIYPTQKAQEFRQAGPMLEWLQRACAECTEYLTSHSLSYTQKFVEHIKSYIEKHYMEDISLHSVSAAVHLSPTYVSKIFKKATGRNFIDYLTSVRMEMAKAMLGNVNNKVYEIASNVGYQSTKHFSQVFKGNTGMTPTEYRDKIHWSKESGH